MKIVVEKISKNFLKTPPKEVPIFGKVFTNRMFTQKYTIGKGWFDSKVTRYSNISLSPSAQVFHYGQEIFEGLKAYKAKDGRILLFRPFDSIQRFNESAIRMQMPPVDETLHLEAMKTLISLEKKWIPEGVGAALYLRPVMIATEDTLWMPSKEYLHFIIACPSGAYVLDKNNSTISVLVEEKYKRAVKGGVGEAKTGGNYAAGLIAHKKAQDMNYNQVLWLDALEGEFIEEAGTMNVFFVYKNGEIITPSLNGSILDGITRKSVLTLAGDAGIVVQERKISIKEVISDIQSHKITEAFGTGTAASLLSIGKIGYQNKDFIIGGEEIGPVSEKLKKTLNDIQYGITQDTYNWTVEVI